MFLNRAGRFLLLLSVGAFILRVMGMQVGRSGTALVGAGIGLGLIVLGSIFGASRRRPAGTEFSAGTRGQIPGYGVDPVHVLGQPAARVLPSCTNCKNPLRSGARFCTRCGVAVAQSGPAVFAPLPAPPRMSGPTRPAVAPAPKKRFPLLRTALLLGLCFYGYGVYTDWQKTGQLPWTGWHLPHELSEAITGSAAVSDSQPLPVAPEPGRASVGAIGSSGPAIDQAWVVPGAMSADGYLGLAVHATVRNPAKTDGLRFVAHFRYDDSSPVYALGTKYADPNGHAATAIAAPEGQYLAQMTAFIPYTALSLRSSSETLQLLPSLYDANNQPVGACQVVPFTAYRGSIYITRVRVESNAQSSLYHGPYSRLLVSFLSSEARSRVGDVVVRFKDEHGWTVAGQFKYGNPPGELRLTTGFSVTPRHGDVTIDDLPVEIPPGVVPPHATAEVSLYDSQSGKALTPPVMFKMP